MGACFSCCPVKINPRKSCQKNIIRHAKPSETSGTHELLELDEKTGATSKPQNHSTGGLFSTNMSKPSRLVFRNMETKDDAPSPTDAMMPLLKSDQSYGDSCSHTGSQGWEYLGSGATPGSSVDLEWENEIGLTPPLNVNEELKWLALTETTNASWQSSPISNNGLEWDGDFTTVDISTIISDTQHLISNIDRPIENP